MADRLIVSALTGETLIEPLAEAEIARRADETPSEEDMRAAWREGAALDMPTLLARLTTGGWITASAARDWARGNTLPALAQGLLAAMPDEEALEAELTLLRMQRAHRASPLVAALAEAWRAANGADITDADLALAVDALFGWPVGE